MSERPGASARRDGSHPMAYPSGDVAEGAGEEGRHRVGMEHDQSIQQSEIESGEDLRRLIETARDGHEPSFQRLYERFAPRLYRFASLRLGDAEAAKDTVQEVFLAIWQRLPAFELRHPDAFAGWVFRIARNVVVDRLRRRATQPVALEEGMGPVFEFEGATISQRLVVEMLGRLPETQRDVVTLRFLVGMSLAEVAEALEKTDGAVEQLQLRGLRRLRKEMGKR